MPHEVLLFGGDRGSHQQRFHTTRAPTPPTTSSAADSPSERAEMFRPVGTPTPKWSFAVLQSPATPQASPTQRRDAGEDLVGNPDDARGQAAGSKGRKTGPARKRKPRGRRGRGAQNQAQLGRARLLAVKEALLDRVRLYLSETAHLASQANAAVFQALEKCRCRALKLLGGNVDGNKVDTLQKELRRVRRRLARLENALKNEREKGGSALNEGKGMTPLQPVPASADDRTATPQSGRGGSRRDPALAKYHRMVGFGVPKQAVIQSMLRDHVDPKRMFADAQTPEANAGGGTPLSGLRRSNRVSASLLQNVKLQRASSRASAVTPGSATPMRSKRRGVVTLEDLKRVQLKATPQKSAGARPAKSSTPGAVLSMEQLQNIKLRPASSRGEKGKENSSAARNLMGGIGKLQLRKTTVERSPGGTPSKPSRAQKRSRGHKLAERSPSNARSDGEFLELALKRKFATLHAYSKSPARSPGSPSSPWSCAGMTPMQKATI